MIGYLDYSDVIREIFIDNDCLIEANISELKGRKLGISFFEIINDLILDVVKQNSWEKGLQEIRKKFDYHDIDTIYVIPGANISMSKVMQDAFWRIKHEWWKMELFKNLYETKKGIEINKFLEILHEISYTYLLDSFTGFYAIHHFRDFLVKTFKTCMKDSIVAPQMVGTQLVWFYDNSEIDAIVGNPTFFVYNGIDQIIGKIDYVKKKYYFYDLHKFARKLGLSVAITRTIILSGYIVFVTDKELCSSPKFLSASKDKVLEFKTNYKSEFDKRKKIFYTIANKMREVLTGDENSAQIPKLISSALDINKVDASNFYNMIFKSPVITNKGELIIYPEKRSLSKAFILDISCKVLVDFYCLGYIDDDLFYLMSKMNDNIFSIKPPRADSLESDYCISNFLLPHIERSLYKIWLISGRPIEKLSETKFNMRLQNGNLMPLNVEPYEIELHTLFTAKSHENVGFYGCLNEFFLALVKEENVIEINNDLSLSENEMLFYVYLSLLNELKYINLKEQKVLVLGASFFKGGSSKYEPEAILFLEMFRLGIIKGERFKPSNIENINKLTMNQLSDQNLINNSSKNENNFSEKSQLTEIQKEFYQSLKNFEEFSSAQHSLTLYQIESTIDKVFITLRQIKSEIYKDNLPNYRALCSKMDEALSKHIHIITFLSKIFTLGYYNYVNPEKFTDYETQQFDQCLKIISQTCYRTLVTNLMYIFMNTSTRNDLSVLDRAIRKLPFNYLGSPDVSALIKTIFTKYIVFKTLEGQKYSYRHTLAAQIQRCNIEDSLDNKLNITEVLENRLEFIDHLLKICSYKQDSFNPLGENLLEAREFLQTFLKES